MLLALRRQTPWIEFDCVPVARVSAGGPLGEACVVLELDRLVPLVGYEPGPVGVVFADRVVILRHERMFAVRPDKPGWSQEWKSPTSKE